MARSNLTEVPTGSMGWGHRQLRDQAMMSTPTREYFASVSAVGVGWLDELL